MKHPEIIPRIRNFEKMAYGMFLHWGLYSLLGKGEWVQNAEKIPYDEYAKLAEKFTAEKFDGNKIAKFAKNAGMKYAVLTTRHHDGYSLYDTCGLNNFDAVNTAPERDLVKDFVDGCRNNDIIPFFYHTTLDWNWNGMDTRNCSPANFAEYLEYLNSSVEILCRNYGKIGGLWFDGNWSRTDLSWQEDKLYSLIRKYQPEAMIINNTGLDARGETGNDEIDSVTFERGRPEPMDRSGMKKYLASEMCQTMNQHWGIGFNDFNYLSPKEIIRDLCACRKVGANLLLNVGPEPDGAIPEYESAALTRVGQWMEIFGEAVREGKPCGIQGENNDFALKSDDGTVYLFVDKPGIKGCEHVTVKQTEQNRIFANFAEKPARISYLDSSSQADFNFSEEVVALKDYACSYGSDYVVRVAEVK